MAKKEAAIPALKAQEPLAEDSALKESGFKQLTVEALENLIVQNPQQAQQYLDLFDKLKTYKKNASERDGIIKMSIMTLKEVQAKAEQDFLNGQACERGSHLREDNRTALVGQRDNNHEVILVCQRCQKIYHGVGGGPKQLPIHLASTVDMSLVGGVQ